MNWINNDMRIIVATLRRHILFNKHCVYTMVKSCLFIHRSYVNVIVIHTFNMYYYNSEIGRAHV